MSTNRPLSRPVASEVFAAKKAETLRMLALITAAVEAKKPGQAAHWGHIGDLGEVISNLRSAAHYAGVTEFVEK